MKFIKRIIIIVFCLFANFAKCADLENCKTDSEILGLEKKLELLELSDNQVKYIKAKIESIYDWAATINHDFKFKYMQTFDLISDFKEFESEEKGFLDRFLELHKNESWYSSLSQDKALVMNEFILQLFREYKSGLSNIDNNVALLQEIYEFIDQKAEGLAKEYNKVFDNKEGYEKAEKDFYYKVWHEINCSFNCKIKILIKYLRTRVFRHINEKIYKCFYKHVKKHIKVV